ncbi:MAG: RdgB/HAM1 family non-canonical purine NTP pyrophosphatase [Candidatus Omnitrophota bacterium]
MSSKPLELIVATKNRKKLEEIRELLSSLDIRVTSLADYPDSPVIVEDGKNFVQNAVKKAATIALWTGKLVLGEDSGLQVSALGNRPGVYSARYSGPQADDASNNRKLLRELKGVPLKKRQARYCCAVALADAKGLIGVAQGTCRGLIGTRSRGHAGFGYDPLFVIEKYAKTFAELGLEVKHRMSHRYRALKKARQILLKYISSL